MTRFCDKYDTVTLCYTQSNFVPALFLFYYFEPWLEALSDRVFHRMMLLWYLIMIKSSYWVWIKSIGQSDRVPINIMEPLLKSRKPSQAPKWRFWAFVHGKYSLNRKPGKPMKSRENPVIQTAFFTEFKCPRTLNVFKRLFNAWLTFVMMRRFFLSASIVKSILFETDINQNIRFYCKWSKKVKSGSEKMNSESPEIPGSTTLQDLRRSNRNYGNGFIKWNKPTRLSIETVIDSSLLR